MKTFVGCATLLLFVSQEALADPMAHQRPDEKANEEADPAVKLVARLGSADFVDRNAAHKELRKLGLRAESALKTGLRFGDLEIQIRCAALLTDVRRIAREALVGSFDPAGVVEPEHPIWKRFKALAGHDRPARRLFAELIASPRRLKLLDDADRDPLIVGKLYLAALNEYYATVAPRLGLPPAEPQPPERPWADELVIHYLGTHLQSVGTVPKTNLECHTFRSWNTALASPAGPAVRRIFAAWYALRDNDYAIECGLRMVAADQITETLPHFRNLAVNEKADLTRRAEAVLMIGLIGTLDDLALLRRVAESKTANDPRMNWSVILKGREHLSMLWGIVRFGGKVTPEEHAEAMKKVVWAEGDRSLADCAWAAAVLVAGGTPHELGFLHPLTVRGEKGQRDRFPYLYNHGFPDAASRAAAHARAKSFVDKQ